jgi:hypothetical protein
MAATMVYCFSDLGEVNTTVLSLEHRITEPDSDEHKQAVFREERACANPASPGLSCLVEVQHVTAQPIAGQPARVQTRLLLHPAWCCAPRPCLSLTVCSDASA